MYFLSLGNTWSFVGIVWSEAKMSFFVVSKCRAILRRMRYTETERLLVFWWLYRKSGFWDPDLLKEAELEQVLKDLLLGLCIFLHCCMLMWCRDRKDKNLHEQCLRRSAVCYLLWGLSGLLAKSTWPECSNDDNLGLLWVPSAAIPTHACSVGTATPVPQRVSFVQRRM